MYNYHLHLKQLKQQATQKTLQLNS